MPATSLLATDPIVDLQKRPAADIATDIPVKKKRSWEDVLEGEGTRFDDTAAASPEKRMRFIADSAKNKK